MATRKKQVFYMLFFTAIILFLILLMQPLELFHFHTDVGVIFPSGLIGMEERNLLLLIQGLMLLVIVPVYILTFVFSWKYRAQNTKATYDPDLVDHRGAEFVWWGVPLVMTTIIAVITWIKTHELDPYKSIPSDKKEITIQVVALQWKWLFIYPDEKIASVNYLQIPVNTPIRFEITADAPMNSFWIPHLGGQIYAMPKMKTELNLIANEEGEFTGVSANISGKGFAGMHFITKVTSDEVYRQWIESAAKSKNNLAFADYQKLAEPSEKVAPEQYQLKDDKLFDQIMMKYMPPMAKE